MATFKMCPPCDREYQDAGDRRFHAQPNACETCGPALEWKGPRMPGARTALEAAVSALRAGKIVAVKSLGGFHLACDPFQAGVVQRLRQRKHRPHKPFAVMFRDLATLMQHGRVNEAEEAELLSVARPIVLVRRESSTLPAALAPDTGTMGAFLPYTPIHHLLMSHFEALVMTSGNFADEPIISEEMELAPLMKSVADAVLTHNRAIVHKCDDSVVRVVNSQRQMIRRARGYTPSAIRIADDCPHLLAVGGELKNTFCLAREGWAFLSQHIGDLKTFATYQHFTREIAEWQRLMRVQPAAIAHDMHPAYLSTRIAGERPDAKRIAVQHHHAHIVSVMAEHELLDKVIGVALDGTGWGTDGTVWGGEFLICDRSDFERVAHFKTYRLPGGDMAVREPWRMAASVLLAEGLRSPHRNADLVRDMIASGFNAPVTSSAGRLFDAVSAMLGLCDIATYEAQAAIRLEEAADKSEAGLYPFELVGGVLDFGDMIRAIMADVALGKPTGPMAARFHNTVAASVAAVCQRARDERGINSVALSGGVFQNELLLCRTLERLQAGKFQVFANVNVPANDGGLALGQAAVAAERMRRSCV
jgi:hydrogenase maturation protein HypF